MMRIWLLAAALLLACDDGNSGSNRAGEVDGAADRGGPSDATRDGAPRDMTPQDMAAPDAGLRDMGPTDGTAAPDMASPDMARPDMASLDMASPDMASPDMASPDMASPDMASPDMADMASPDMADMAPRHGRPTWRRPIVAASGGRSPTPSCSPRLHANVQGHYRPIEPERDRGGNLNRYTTARHFMFTQVERVSDEAGDLGAECVYTGRFVALGPDAEPANADINAEHVWPRARMNPDQDGAPYAHQQSDLHNLYPTDAGANSTRGSDAFGEVVADRDLNHLPAVAGLDAQGTRVFQPRAERQGDIARAVLYNSVRWGYALRDAEEEVLRRWVVQDPVDAREHLRNDRIEAIQGNRNPFADCPELVERIADFVAFPPLDVGLALP
jgi:deoxyribonuclease-1